MELNFNVKTEWDSTEWIQLSLYAKESEFIPEMEKSTNFATDRF
jgi:hypothetical protein